MPSLTGERLAKCHDALAGSLRTNRGRFAEAETANREAVTVLRRVVSEDPKTPAYREDLAVSLDNLGVALRSLKGSAEAEASHREALAVYEGLVREIPEEPHYGDELGRGLVHLAVVERDRKEYSKAAYPSSTAPGR